MTTMYRIFMGNDHNLINLSILLLKMGSLRF